MEHLINLVLGQSDLFCSHEDEHDLQLSGTVSSPPPPPQKEL